MKVSDLDLLEKIAHLQACNSFYAYRQFINPKLKLGWWQREIANELQQFYEDLIAGKRPKLVIEAPPQHGKSLLIIEFLSWVAGKNPDFRTIYASFSERLGVRANLRLQRIFNSDKYKRLFPKTVIGGADSICSRELIEYTGTEGYFRNTTVNGSITGESLDLGVVDDPVKGREAANSQTVRDKTWDWWCDDFSTRFSEEAGLLVILTRWHVDDPVGRLCEIDPSVKVLKYAAEATKDEPHRKKGEPLFPEHKSLEFLHGIKRIMPTSSWESLYQQNPFVAEGEFYKPDNIKILDAMPLGITAGTRGWDLAATEGGGDWTVGVRMHKQPNGRILISDMVRFQKGPDGVEEALKNTADRDGRSIRIRGPADPGQAGKAQAARLTRLLSGYKVEFLPVTGEKTVRAGGFASQVNAGNVDMVRATWNDALINELRMFPNGLHDDISDAAADAFEDVNVSLDAVNMWKKLGAG